LERAPSGVFGIYEPVAAMNRGAAQRTDAAIRGCACRVYLPYTPTARSIIFLMIPPESPLLEHIFETIGQ